MENQENQQIEPTVYDDSQIWRYIYNKKIKERSENPIDSGFFTDFCEKNDVNFGPDQAFEYYMNVMIGDLYKEPGLDPYEILELYMALKIKMSIHQLETLEKYFTVFLKLNSQRILVSWSLPRNEAVKRAYEPPVTDQQPKKRYSPMTLDCESNCGDSGGGCLQNQNQKDSEDRPGGDVVGDSGEPPENSGEDVQDSEDPVKNDVVVNLEDSAPEVRVLEDFGEDVQQNPLEDAQDSEEHDGSPLVTNTDEWETFWGERSAILNPYDAEEPEDHVDSAQNLSEMLPDPEEHSRNVAVTDSGDVQDSEEHEEQVTIIRMQPEDVEAEEVVMEDVEVLGEIQRQDSDDDGDVTIERVISGDAEIPEDVEEKMWEYIGKNFEKDRPSRFLTTALWEVFKTEKLGDTTLIPLQLINHFTRNMLPALWNRPVPIETRLQILRATRMPITDDQKTSLENEFELKIQVNQLNCIEEWEKTSEATPQRRTSKRRIVMSSDSEDDAAPEASGTPRTTRSNRRIHLPSDSENDTPRTPQQTPKTPAIQKSAHSIGSKPIRNPRTGRATRSIYTPGDDKSMWEFLLAEIRAGSEVKPKGLEIWKRYIDKTECWREPANLASHYKRYMAPKLHLTCLSLPDKLKLYMQCEITCPSVMIRRFRKGYHINHQDMIITFAKKRTNGDQEEEEEVVNADDSDDVESPTASEAPRRSTRVSRKPAKLED